MSPRHDEPQQFVRSLLREIAPPQGVTALLLKHPIGHVYFPLALAEGENFPGYTDEIINKYFLFSMEIPNPTNAGNGIVLVDNSPITDLVLFGKLAVNLFDHGPVAIQSVNCDSHGDVVVCAMTPTATTQRDPWKPSPNICRALAAGVNMWRSSAETNIQISDDDPKQITATLGAVLSDTAAGPPYFPLLYVAVDCQEGGRMPLTHGPCNANALAHNCYIFAERERLVTDYIRFMICEADPSRSYEDNGPQNSPGLPAAIASVCIDVVHQIGRHAPSGTTAYARRNIPRSDLAGTGEKHLHLGNDLRNVDTTWKLLRSTLQYLRRPHDDSSIVTAWVGALDPGGALLTALPVGSVPGGRVGALEKAATHPAIKHMYFESDSKDGRLSARVVALGPDVAGDASPPHRLLAEKLVGNFIERGAAAIRGAPVKFPGPYLLDFKNGGVLHITSLASPNLRPRFITRQDDDRELWDFLYALCMANHKGEPWLSHTAITAEWGGNKGIDPATFVDRMKHKLKSNNTSPVDPGFLFDNESGRGWRWAPEKKSQYENITISVNQTTNHGDIDSFDPTRQLGQRKKTKPIQSKE